MTCELAKTLRLDLFAFVTGERAMDFALGRGSTERRAVAVFEEELTHFHVFFVACRLDVQRDIGQSQSDARAAGADAQ